MSNRVKRNQRRGLRRDVPADVETAMFEAIRSVHAEVEQALHGVRTALEAELTVADLLGSLDHEAPAGASGADREAVAAAVAAGLALCAASAPNPTGAVLLRALTALGPPGAREIAVEATHRVRAVGVCEPRWAAGIGTAQPVRAFVHGDIWGHQETLGVVFTQDGREHVVMVLVDHGLGGGIKDAWCADDVTAVEDQVRAANRSSMHTLLTDVPLPEARRVLAEALARPECPVEDDQLLDAPAHRALLKARLAGWPATPAAEAPAMRPGQVARIKVGLAGARPPIWRRLEVPAEITLDELHEVIQACFGWDGTHLHAFSGRSARYADPDHAIDDGADETRVPLLGALEGGRLTYLYDFGDSWEHRIELEEVLAAVPAVAYPRCTGGRRAAPPDDIGGIWHYSWLVAAAADRSDPEHATAAARLTEWGVTSPARFDAEELTRMLRPLARVVTSGPAGASRPQPPRPRQARPARTGGTATIW